MSIAVGNSEEVKKTLNMLKAGDQSLISIYSDHMTKTPAEIEAMMSAETWFTDADSIAVGLATKADGQAKQQPQVANWFKNTPAALSTRTKPQVRTSAAASVTVPKYRYVSPLR